MTKSGKYYLMQHIHTRRIILRCVRIQRKSWMSLEGREEWDPGSSLASRLAGMKVKMKLWLGGKIWDVQKIYDMGHCLYLNMWISSMMPIHDAHPWRDFPLTWSQTAAAALDSLFKPGKRINMTFDSWCTDYVLLTVTLRESDHLQMWSPVAAQADLRPFLG